MGQMMGYFLTKGDNPRECTNWRKITGHSDMIKDQQIVICLAQGVTSSSSYKICSMVVLQ
jgi:hypothetical protein